jgi:hypothetical protein
MKSSSRFAGEIATAEGRKSAAAKKKRYSILVREAGSDHEVELCEVSSNPKKTAEAAGMKRLRKSSVGRRYYTKKYDWIRIVDNGEVVNQFAHPCG